MNSSHPRNPKTQQENDNGDVHMDDGTAEEEKVKHSTEQDQQLMTPTPRNNLTG
jgi:hypothetical protein